MHCINKRAALIFAFVFFNVSAMEESTLVLKNSGVSSFFSDLKSEKFDKIQNTFLKFTEEQNREVNPETGNTLAMELLTTLEQKLQHGSPEEQATILGVLEKYLKNNHEFLDLETQNNNQETFRDILYRIKDIKFRPNTDFLQSEKNLIEKKIVLTPSELTELWVIEQGKLAKKKFAFEKQYQTEPSELSKLERKGSKLHFPSFRKKDAPSEKPEIRRSLSGSNIKINQKSISNETELIIEELPESSLPEPTDVIRDQQFINRLNNKQDDAFFDFLISENFITKAIIFDNFQKFEKWWQIQKENLILKKNHELNEKSFALQKQNNLPKLERKNSKLRMFFGKKEKVEEKKQVRRSLSASDIKRRPTLSIPRVETTKVITDPTLILGLANMQKNNLFINKRLLSLFKECCLDEKLGELEKQLIKEAGITNKYFLNKTPEEIRQKLEIIMCPNEKKKTTKEKVQQIFAKSNTF